jgi:twitching motility two-component system response regulator PilH
VSVPGRILIVEDHPTMREAMRLVLEGGPHVVAEATDGRAALEAISLEPPDVVLLDLNIPGASGAEVLEHIKGDPATSDVRVVIVTATGEEGRDLAMRLGADAYLTKPFSPTTLLQTVEQVLGGSDSTEG